MLFIFMRLVTEAKIAFRYSILIQWLRHQCHTFLLRRAEASISKWEKKNGVEYYEEGIEEK